MSWRRWAVLVGVITTATVMVACGAPASSAKSRSPGAAGPPAGFQPQSLERIGDGQGIVVAGTAPCGRLACAVVLSGALGADGLVHHWHRLRTPPIPATHNALSLNVGTLAFASSLDGYDVVPPSTLGGEIRVYVTTDGGTSWHQARINAGTVLTLAEAPSGFYAVTARCRFESCDDYRLAHSAAGTTRWSSTPIPGTAGLGGSPVGLAVQGTEVLLNFQPAVKGGPPHLLIASNSRAPFEIHLMRPLVSVGACVLSPQPGGAVWASCATGMLVSYLHSPSADGPYVGVWRYAGTGGGGFVPVTGNVAYRYTGIAVSSPEKLPGDIVQRSTNGGRTFTDAGPWPFARNLGTTPQFLFLDEQEGFGLGPTPTNAASSEVVETADGGRHWTQVLP